MNKLLRIFQRTHQPDTGALSAYLDGALPAARAAQIEAHAAGCELCRTTLGELRATRALLASMPQADTPRSFRLRQADVEARVAAPRASPLLRLAPAMSVAAIVIFALIVGLDVRAGGGVSITRDSAASRTSLQAAAPAPSGGAGTVANGPSLGDIAPEGTVAGAPSNRPAFDGSGPAKDAATDTAGAPETTAGTAAANPEPATGGETSTGAATPSVAITAPLPDTGGVAPPPAPSVDGTPGATEQYYAATPEAAASSPDAAASDGASATELASGGEARNEAGSDSAAGTPTDADTAKVLTAPSASAAASPLAFRSTSPPSASGDDGRDGYRIAEAISGLVALGAAGLAIGTWSRRRSADR